MATSSHPADPRKILQRLSGAFEERAARGLFPYEGEWVAAGEIPARQDQELRQARLQFWEIVAALTVIGLLGVAMLLLLWALLY